MKEDTFIENNAELIGDERIDHLLEEWRQKHEERRIALNKTLWELNGDKETCIQLARVDLIVEELA